MRTYTMAMVTVVLTVFSTSTASAQAEIGRRINLDADARNDIVVFDRSGGDAGTWYVLQGGTNYTTAFSVKWGDADDVPVPADYDGDGRSDIAVYDTGGADTGTWYVLLAGTNYTTAFSVKWGNGNVGTTDLPTPGDYDGDGEVDIAVFRRNPGGGDDGIWYVLQAGSNFSTAFSITFGTCSGPACDYPVPRDFDGDGRLDIAVWRFLGPGAGTWYILQAGTNYTTAFSVVFGTPSAAADEIPVPADYDGDGRNDIAVFVYDGGGTRSDRGTWYVLQGGTNYTTAFSVQFGAGFNTERPVTGDYDGDGRTDIAFWKIVGGDAGTWYVLQAGTNYTTAFSVVWGTGGGADVPVSNRNVPPGIFANTF